ncbi:hypothetical protein SCOR_33115 [Sulfidibacter corallicola]|uniref:DNA-binding protein n=1 Tax=Sulfidibacter corallicola TaxID=2818388 RepID=A0A8A4TL66_SULCO|nr:hypothetical protein [Sulfidibacter corallicola]QTD49621.1 hypothetical protein J3U87_28880 [Sulfidibacter corallicola]
MNTDFLDAFHQAAAKTKTPEAYQSLKRDTFHKIRQAIFDDEHLMNEREVAKFFRAFTVRGLQAMRGKGSGPRYLKFGNSRNARVFYKVKDVRDFIDRHYQDKIWFEQTS